MRHWLDPLIFFHKGNVANTVECFLWVRNLSCVSFVAIFVSRPYLWESDRIGCFVAYFFCLNNLGRSKSHFYPFGETKLQQRHTQQSTGVNKLAPQHEKDYGTCGNDECCGIFREEAILTKDLNKYHFSQETTLT